jgi:orotidine-5'-phosphate decarboxylase
MKQKRVIVVLDFPDAKTALGLASRLDANECRVKVGKELHTAAGPAVVDQLMRMGFDVFLDLKFHDIPNTVASACRVAASQGVWMLNVHAAGGSRMLAAARDAIDAVQGAKPLLIGVTVLTSLSASELPEIGLAPDVNAAVLRYATLVSEAGLDGVVCSAEEAPLLKSHFGDRLQLVTPGIRLASDAKGDQSRVVTPVDALKLGAGYLVIGRSITQAADPVATLKQINHDLNQQELTA